MNNLSSNNPSLNLGQSSRSLKLLIFSIGKLNLALPVEIVKKVLDSAPVYGSGLNHMGIARIDDHEITVVDLHKRLFHVSQQLSSDSRVYTIVARNSVGESFGILVGQTPTLQDVSLSQIRALPASYRRADTLEIASHVTVIAQKEESLTVFLLDPDRLVPPVSGAIDSSSWLSAP
jgi:purine-binding chemotaxis protein CheW